MTSPHADAQGAVVSLWRYPVKSMLGEELNASALTPRGLLGDRAYALVDTGTGKVVSAKNPRKWPNIFDFRAAYRDDPRPDSPVPAVRIMLPNGDQVRTDDPNVDRRLSAALGRAVRLESSASGRATIEGYWPDHEWLEHRDEVFDVKLPEGTFFDLTPVHLITTSTLDRLRAAAPGSRFEARRFRPNLVVSPTARSDGFVEDAWIGRRLKIGPEVVLQVTEPCPRCVMTTLSQGDLPKDPGVLRAAVEQNEGNVGVCATVVHSGRVCRGDAVFVE